MIPVCAPPAGPRQRPCGFHHPSDALDDDVRSVQVDEMAGALYEYQLASARQPGRSTVPPCSGVPPSRAAGWRLPRLASLSRLSAASSASESTRSNSNQPSKGMASGDDSSARTPPHGRAVPSMRSRIHISEAWPTGTVRPSGTSTYVAVPSRGLPGAHDRSASIHCQLRSTASGPGRRGILRGGGRPTQRAQWRPSVIMATSTSSTWATSGVAPRRSNEARALRRSTLPPAASPSRHRARPRRSLARAAS